MEELAELPPNAYRPEGGTHLIGLLTSGRIECLVRIDHLRGRPTRYRKVTTEAEFHSEPQYMNGDQFTDWYAVPAV